MLKKRIFLSIFLILVILLQSFSIAGAAENTFTSKIVPYITHNASDENQQISMTGVSYDDAIIFTMGYTGLDNGSWAQVNYNLKGQYSKLTFFAGFYNGEQRNANFNVSVDGTVVIDTTINHSDLAKKYSIDVSGAKQVSITFSSGGYDKTRYAIANIVAESTTEIPENQNLETNVFYNCEPYQYTNASKITDTFSMGGNTYVGGFNLRMGYTGNSTGGNSYLYFNFQEHYEKISFDIALYGKSITYTRDATLTITADGETLYSNYLVKWNSLPQHFEIDLKGVNQLVIHTVSSGYDTVNYRIGNLQLKSDGVLRGITFKNTSGTVDSNKPNFKVEPVIIPPDAVDKDYTLKSDSTITAVVDENGVVTGRHAGTANIIATTTVGGFSANCKITSNMPAARYVPSVDGWGFSNYTIDITDTFSDYYNSVYQRISGVNLLYSLNLKRDLFKYVDARHYYYTLCGMMGTGGMCAGMAISSALIYSKDINLSDFKFDGITPTKPGDIKEIDKNLGYSANLDMYLMQYIYACYISQGSLTSVYDEWKNADKYDDLINAVINFQNNGGIPVSIKMNDAHEVVGYEVIKKEDTIEVYIYDSNLDEDPDDNKIVFYKDSNGKITGWSYGRYSNNNGDIKYRTNTKKIADRIKNSEVSADFVDNLIVTTSNAFSIKNKFGSSISYSNGVFGGDKTHDFIIPIGISNSDSAAQTRDETVLYCNTDDEILIQYDDSSEETVQTFFGNENMAIIIESDGNSEVRSVFSDEEKLFTVSPSKNDNVVLCYNNNANSLIINGSVDKSFSADIDEVNNAINITGLSSIQITTINEEGEKTEEPVLLDSKKTYTVYSDGYINTSIPGDVDENGKVTAADARLILRYSAQLEKFSEYQIQIADFNQDKKVTSSDARSVLRLAAGLI